MRQIGRGLRRLGIEPDRIVTSPLPRALQTAEIVAERAGAVRPARGLRRAPRRPRRRGDPRLAPDPRPRTALMIVGHNPTLSDLLGLLVTGEPTPRSAS